MSSVPECAYRLWVSWTRACSYKWTDPGIGLHWQSPAVSGSINSDVSISWFLFSAALTVAFISSTNFCLTHKPQVHIPHSQASVLQPYQESHLYRLVVYQDVCTQCPVHSRKEVRLSKHQIKTQEMADLQSGSSCRSRGGRWGPSSAGTLGTPLWSGHTGSPCSLASRTLPRPHSPPGWSCSGSGRSGNPSSRCHTHSDGPGSSCPRRRQSVGQHLGVLAFIQMSHRRC